MAGCELVRCLERRVVVPTFGGRTRKSRAKGIVSNLK